MEMTNVTTTRMIPKEIFSPFIKPVITIVITTRQISIGSSKIRCPQSFLSLSFDMKYFKSDTNTNKDTESQKA